MEKILKDYFDEVGYIEDCQNLKFLIDSHRMLRKILSNKEDGELKSGDKWFVKLHEAKCLTEQKIVEVTEKTVLLERIDDNSCLHSKLRYKRSDIEFVEKVNYND